jgi:hypothetical protein
MVGGFFGNVYFELLMARPLIVTIYFNSKIISPFNTFFALIVILPVVNGVA